MQFVLGAGVFGLGILVGVAIVQSNYDRILKNSREEDI